MTILKGNVRRSIAGSAISLKKASTMIAAVGALLGCGAASATIINGSFEDSDVLTGTYEHFSSISGSMKLILSTAGENR
jgi:hypothetical protein